MTHYEEYQKTGDTNYFEEIIDAMVLDGISGMNDSFKNAIKSLPKEKKRMTILSLLDKDLNLFTKIKSFVSNEKLSKVDHLKDVILMLREYVKVGEVEKKKFGEVMTDLNLVKHILSRIPEEDFKDPNKTFIDFANGTGVFPLVVIYKLMQGLEDLIPDPEERYKHIIENQIYVSEIQPKNMFLYMCLVDPHDEYKLNIYTGSSLEDGSKGQSAKFRNHMKNVWKRDKFDYGIGNPPFNQMIDMKFVRLSYDLCDVTCIVHPSTWLLDEKRKQKAFIETKELVKDHLESIELFNGNGIFSVSLFVPCVITYINKNKIVKGIKCYDKINNTELEYDNISQINKFSNLSIYPNIKNKIMSHSLINNLSSRMIKYDKNNTSSNDSFFYVNISRIRGHVDLKSSTTMLKDDFYTIVTKDSKVEMRPIKSLYFKFEDNFLANNFLHFLKTKFCRFSLSLYKNASYLDRGEMKAIPWLDFTKEWTDEKLYEEFNLTEEEIEFIEKHIPKYY